MLPTSKHDVSKTLEERLQAECDRVLPLDVDDWVPPAPISMEVVSVAHEKMDDLRARAPAQIDKLLDKALHKLDHILDMAPSPFDDDYAKLLSIQKDAALSVVNLSIKADENRFRIQNETAIVEILKEVKGLKGKPVPAVVIDQAAVA